MIQWERSSVEWSSPTCLTSSLKQESPMKNFLYTNMVVSNLCQLVTMLNYLIWLSPGCYNFVLNIYICIEEFFFSKHLQINVLKTIFSDVSLKLKFTLVEILYQCLKTTSCQVLLLLNVGTSWCQFCSFELFVSSLQPVT